IRHVSSITQVASRATWGKGKTTLAILRKGKTAMLKILVYEWRPHRRSVRAECRQRPIRQAGLASDRGRRECPGRRHGLDPRQTEPREVPRACAQSQAR